MRNAILAALACGALIAWLLLRGGGGENAVVAPTVGARSVEHATHVGSAAAIVGRVVANGQPLAGACIAVFDHDGHHTLGSSDRDGRFRIAMPPGTYEIGVSAERYLPGFVEKAETDRPLEVELQPGGSLVTGLVADSAGGPLVGAVVTANLDDGELATASDATGRYRMTLPTGHHMLSAAHDDYARGFCDALVAEAPATCDFALGLGSEISGIVVASDTRAPIANAVVQVQSKRGMFDDFGHATTDGEGRFVISGLLAGNATLTVETEGWRTAAAITFELAYGQHRSELVVPVVHGFSVRGTLVDADNAPIAESYVDARRENLLTMSSTVSTDEHGAFAIHGLAPGRYRISDRSTVDVQRDVDGVVVRRDVHQLTVSGRVEPAVPATIHIDGFSVRTDREGRFSRRVDGVSNDIVAISDDHRYASEPFRKGEALVLHLAAGASVRGIVLDLAGHPVAAAAITASDSMHEWTAVADASGRFAFTGLPATKIRFQAHRGMHHAGPLVSAELDKPVADLELRAPAYDRTLRGDVRDGSGAPVADVIIDIFGHGLPPMVTSRADGTFEVVELEPGAKYQVTAHASGAFATASVAADADHVSLVLTPLATIVGTVTIDGAAATELEVYCDRMMLMQLASAPGEFRLEHLEPGEYTCTVHAGGREAHVTAMASAGTTTNVAVAMPRLRTIRGRAVDLLTGAPVADSSVEVLNSARATTDATGAFELAGAVDTGTISFYANGVYLGSQGYGKGVREGEPIDVGTVRIATHREPSGQFPFAYYGGIAHDVRVGPVVEGDAIVAIDGVAATEGELRAYLAVGLTPGRTYKLALARGVTVDVTAE